MTNLYFGLIILNFLLFINLKKIANFVMIEAFDTDFQIQQGGNIENNIKSKTLNILHK